MKRKMVDDQPSLTKEKPNLKLTQFCPDFFLQGEPYLTLTLIELEKIRDSFGNKRVSYKVKHYIT